MKKTALFVFVLSLVLGFSSCEKSIFCKNGSGEVLTEERSVSNFTQIDYAIPGELIITQSDTISVTIEAQENLIPDIETNIEGNVLEIKQLRINVLNLMNQLLFMFLFLP